jgi:hypothetical protein
VRTGQGTVGYVNGNKDLDPGGVCGLCSRTARVALNLTSRTVLCLQRTMCGVKMWFLEGS